MVEIETESEITFLKRHLQAIGTPHNCKYIIKFVILILKNDTVFWDIPDECNPLSTCLDANVIANVT